MTTGEDLKRQASTKPRAPTEDGNSPPADKVESWDAILTQASKSVPKRIVANPKIPIGKGKAVVRHSSSSEESSSDKSDGLDELSL